MLPERTIPRSAIVVMLKAEHHYRKHWILAGSTAGDTQPASSELPEYSSTSN